MILIFAGTTEGRTLAEYASEHGIRCIVSTATEYGRSLIEELPGVCIRSGRMDRAQISTFIQEHEVSCVIDATHPFAVEATRQIREACEESAVTYIRCLRENGGTPEEGSVIVDSVQEAADYLAHTEGNILIATGSKELSAYTKIPDYRTRCFARVLSTREAVGQSAELGFEGKNLIAMQGPFSKELNLALLKQVNARYFVTKESGKAGGFEEKARAAEEAGAELIVVGRPKEEGLSAEEVKKLMLTEQPAATIIQNE